MPVLKGREAEQRRRDQVPDKIRKILRGAARAGATVIATDAKERVASDAVREGVIVGCTKEVDGKITVRITVKEGWPRALGTWLEYGTSAHFISVDPNFAEGRTAARVNKLDKDAAKNGESGPGSTLVINGKAVGATVYHPGAREQPWLRPARDIKARDAVAAAQEHINARVRRSGPVADGNDE
jgi:hypothetical protein